METLQSSPYPKKEFLINVLTSQGGGGHYAMYNALRAVVEQKQLPWRFTVTDIDEIADNLANQKKIVGRSVLTHRKRFAYSKVQSAEC